MKFTEYLRHLNYTPKQIAEIMSKLKDSKGLYPPEVEYAITYALTYSAFTSFPLETRWGRRDEARRKYIELSLSYPQMKRSEKIKLIADKMNVKTDCIRVYLRETEM